MDIPGDAPTSTAHSLTPAEVHNVAFKKPPIGKRGYDEEEVDSFLDMVEAALSGLIEENQGLRNQPSGMDPSQLSNVTDQSLIEENRRLSEALAQAEAAQQEQSGAIARLQQEHASSLAAATQGKGDAGEAQLRLQEALQAAEQRAQVAEQAAAQAQEQARQAASAQPSGGVVGNHEQAVKVLALAQQTADQHLAASKNEADTMVNEAKAVAAQLHQESTAAADRRVNDAQTQADNLQRDSEARAAKTVQDAEQHAAAVNEALETRKAALERRLDELSTFEREYRSRLKSYLESQLRDLEHGGSEDGAAPSQQVAQQN